MAAKNISLRRVVAHSSSLIRSSMVIFISDMLLESFPEPVVLVMDPVGSNFLNKLCFLMVPSSLSRFAIVVDSRLC